MTIWSDTVQDHVSNRRHVGPLEGATHQGVAGVPGDGPYMILWFEVRQGRILRAAYHTYGCVAAIASGSITATLLTGTPVEKALLLTAQDINRVLGGLPEGKEHCPQLAITAMRNALAEKEE
jgi:nitrogen fixation protein NifU and related proteins